MIDISNLDFAYESRLVLKHINLQVPTGSTLGVIGPNAGGKTTLMRLLLGLLTPTRGSVAIAGMTPKQAIRRGDVIGYLPQAQQVAENFPLSVEQLVRLGLVGKLGLMKSETREDREHVAWLMHHVGIEELAETPAALLSGGQLQRVFIARALAAKPKILLLDEPTTGIDRSGQEQFMEFLTGIKQMLGLTVVLVSHDLRTVTALCDRLACLNVTLHYHDVAGNMPEELAKEFFGGDAPARKIQGSGAAC